MTATPPRHLGTHGKKLYRDITSEFELRADELIILEQACGELDVCKRLEAEVAALGSFRTKGSRGQDVACPEVQELRQHNMTLASLLSRLKISDEASDAKPMTPFQVAQMGGKARAARGRAS